MINTLRIFLIAYYYIAFKLAETFIFINAYIKKLFFYRNCRKITILLRDFAADLTTTILIKKKISLLETRLKVA